MTDSLSPHRVHKLTQDLRRTYSLATGNNFSRILSCVREPGVQAVIVFRFGSWLLGQPLILKIPLTPIYLYLDHRMKAKWGIQIQRRARIGAGFYVGHYGGIFVSSEATIGTNCTISQNVTIGVAGKGERRGGPTIGDNVYIAPGANVCGRHIIGNNAQLGPNVVVTMDVPENALVHLPPMKHVCF